MKFADIVKGARARKAAEVMGLDGKTKIQVAVRILMPEDDAAIEEAAVEFARAHKVADPKPGNTQYERGLVIHTLLRGCLDPDVTAADEPYFASEAEIAKHLDDARMLHLHFQQRAFQREVSPNPGKGDPVEFLALLYQSATAEAKGEDPALPFVGLPYGTLLNFAAQSASLLSSRLRRASVSGSESPTDTPSSSSSAPV